MGEQRQSGPLDGIISLSGIDAAECESNLSFYGPAKGTFAPSPCACDVASDDPSYWPQLRSHSGTLAQSTCRREKTHNVIVKRRVRPAACDGLLGDLNEGRNDASMAMNITVVGFVSLTTTIYMCMHVHTRRAH